MLGYEKLLELLDEEKTEKKNFKIYNVVIFSIEKRLHLMEEHKFEPFAYTHTDKIWTAPSSHQVRIGYIIYNGHA